MSTRRAPALPRRLCVLVDADSAAAESLRIEWLRTGRRERDLEIVPVPASDGSPTAAELLGVLAETRGTPGDVIGLVAAGAFFTPGSLPPLMDRLEDDPDCGAVMPRVFADEGLVLQPPLPVVPTPTDELLSVLARIFPSDARVLGKRRVELSLGWWSGRRVERTEAVSGDCVLFRRDVLALVEEALYEVRGGRQDLLWELSSRLGELGLDVVCEGRSSVLSVEWLAAGESSDTEAEREAHLARRHPGLATRLVRAARGLLARFPKSRLDRPAWEAEELGELDRPVRVELPRGARCICELSREPNFLGVVGVAARGGPWRLKETTWARLGSGTWWLRAVDQASGLIVGCWTFEKPADGRAEPVTPADWEQLRGGGRDEALAIA